MGILQLYIFKYIEKQTASRASRVRGLPFILLVEYINELKNLYLYILCVFVRRERKKRKKERNRGREDEDMDMDMDGACISVYVIRDDWMNKRGKEGEESRKDYYIDFDSIRFDILFLFWQHN